MTTIFILLPSLMVLNLLLLIAVMHLTKFRIKITTPIRYSRLQLKAKLKVLRNVNKVHKD